MREARERGKIECGQTHKTGRRQSRRREGNRKESEMNGKDVRRERGEPGRGHQSLVRRGNPEPLGRASVTDLGQDHQVRHVDKQVDGCQDGHNQSLVPDAHVGGELINAAQLVRSLGLPAELLVELVESPEDQGSGVEEDGEHRLPKH